jgi:hypothetical protein
MSATLPERLHKAYDWTAAAGELDELRALEGAELDRYCDESAANSDGAVAAPELLALALWLRKGAP